MSEKKKQKQKEKKEKQEKKREDVGIFAYDASLSASFLKLKHRSQS